MPLMELDEARGQGPAAGPLDHRGIRRHNGTRILDAVRRHGPISRAALARHADLSPPTVTAPRADVEAGDVAEACVEVDHQALQLADVRLFESL